MNDLGATLRAARVAAGLSLDGMSRLTHFSKSTLGHIETGRRVVQGEHVIAYSRALGLSIETLYGKPLDPLRMAHEWLVRETPVHEHLKSGRRIGSTLIGTLEDRVVELRHLDRLVGGRDLLHIVQREFEEVQMLAKEASFVEVNGRRLLVVVGELAQLAGWVASDAGRYPEAQATYLTGVAAARQADDQVLVGQLFSSLAYQMANVGDPADAVLLAQSAVAGAPDAVPAVKTLLQERLAWSYARARDKTSAMRTLGLVDEGWERRSHGDDEPGWVYWLNRHEIDVMAGRCLIELGQPSAAKPLLLGAIEAYSPDLAREKALYMTWLAESQANAGELDEARLTLEQARTVSGSVQSSRLELRMRQVERLAN